MNADKRDITFIKGILKGDGLLGDIIISLKPWDK